MNLTKTHKIVLGIAAVIVLVLVYAAFDRKSNKNDTVVNTNAGQTATTTGNSNGNIVIQGKGYTIEQVPLSEGRGVPQPIPNLDRPALAVGYASVSPQALAVAGEKIPALQEILKKNPADFPSWLNLGMYQKMAGDYQGAVISWTYASKLAPTDSVSLGNLGNLYAYFLKDSALSEMYYKQAIAKGPKQAYLYVQLAEVYSGIFKDISKARAIVDQGLAKIPNDPSLLQMKAALK